jgi:hypothetical protein
VSRHTGIDAAFLVVALATAAPFVLPFAGIATGPGGEELRLYVGNLSKLGFLACAAVMSSRAAARFEPDNPMRPVWRVMAAGLFAFVAGELVLVTYQVLWRLPSPFPSLADAFFVVAYPFLLAALVRAISAYAETGYPIGTRRERVGTAVAVGVATALVGYPVLRPVLDVPAAPLAMVLNVAYPVLDLAVLVPVIILLRIAVRFRGGEVWKVWAGLLAGFLLMTFADVLFAYFTATGKESLDQLVDATYILSYAALARGALGQYQLLRD